MLQFMKNKVLIPLVITGAIAAFLSFKYIGKDDTPQTNDRKVYIQDRMMSAIDAAHYAPRELNDSFSVHVYNELLETIDYDKKFFNKQDLAKLDKFKFGIDDELRNHSVAFYDNFTAIFTSTLDRTEAFYKEALKTPFQFTTEESIQLNGDKLDFPANDAAQKQRWHDLLKYRVLARYVEMQKEQEAPADTVDGIVRKKEKAKTNAEMEAAARESVLKNQDRYFKSLRQLDDVQRFAIYMNAIAHVEDPHTDYFPPEDKKRFDEAMSGSFFGIGAQLKDDEGKIKVVAIIAGTPSWKQGDLKAGDVIIKVAQGKAEPEDIRGLEINDVIKKIRGPKGTEVRLTVTRIDGSQKVVPIVRDKVDLEDTYARSAVLGSGADKVGYIYLPEFYANFNDAAGRRCATDVAKEVIKLKAAGVSGIILDLRNNGGGSLSDVVDMAGLFIDAGPMVQVESGRGGATVLRDQDRGILYDGPMAVMINQGSASASEIMAAAMQDYRRAIIVGTPSFGKGTVQKILPLDESDIFGNIKNTGVEPIGSLKITVQKFYRINGGSTQLRGVTPDIVLPDIYSQINLGERRDKAALPWDEIPAADYSGINGLNVAMLKAASNKRVAENGIYNLVVKSTYKMKQKEDDNSYSLNEKKYRAELDSASVMNDKMEELQKLGKPLTLTNPKEDLPRINLDSSTVLKNQTWLKNVGKDIYISETVNIINDMRKGGYKMTETGMK